MALDAPQQDYADAPVPAGVVADFFVFRLRPDAGAIPPARISALGAWIAGSVAGLVETYSGHSVSGVAAVDSIAIPAAGHIAMHRLLTRTPRVPTASI